MSSSLVALALATPVFGFALAPPTYVAPAIAIDPPTELEATEPALDPAVQHRLDTRNTMADWMTALGIASLGGMAVTNVIGAIQFHDHYGFSASSQDTPCARGQAVMREYCEGTVWPFTISSGITSALYITTASLGLFMPDPLGESEQPGPHGERIRLHRSIRWVTSALVIVQSLLGGLIALGEDWFGLDPQNDFDAYQGLAFARLATSVAAMSSLAVQGSVMLF